MIAILLLAAALPRLFTGGNVDGMEKLPPPRVQYRMNRASASTAPWVDSNAWRYLRPAAGKPMLVEAAPGQADLAAAEAYVFDGDVAVQPASAADKASLEHIIAFLGALPPKLPPLANIDFLDDGSAAAGENMNLMVRRNLLFRIGAAGSGVKVKPNSGDPSKVAYDIRRAVGDDNRLVRIYGSEVVIARLRGDSDRRQLQLLNYGTRPVQGVRLRVRGSWPSITVRSMDGGLTPVETEIANGATEFTLETVPVFSEVELQK